MVQTMLCIIQPQIYVMILGIIYVLCLIGVLIAFTYIDGVEEASPSITSIGDMSSGSPIYIGTTKDTNLHLNGLVDEVRIYNKALSADEVTKNYNNGKSSHQ